MFTSAIENMRTANRIVMTAIDVFVPTKTKPNVVAASRSMPTMPIARGAMLVEDAPRNGIHDTHDDGAGHDDKARHRRGVAQKILHVNGHEHGATSRDA